MQSFFLLTARIAASFMIFSISAPEKPTVLLAKALKSTSLASFLFLECTLKIAALPSLSGNETVIFLSKRPALNKHEREIVAHHEAGHAIIGLKLEHSDKVQKITIIPRGNTGGHVRMTPEEDRFLLTKKELEARIVGYLGGRSAEEVFFDDISSGAQNDIEMATRIARMMVTELGMSSLGPIQYERDTGSVFLGRDYASTQKNFSLATAEQIDTEVKKIINDAHDLAVKLIKDNKAQVELIAQTLLKHEQITAEEIDYLLEHGHLKKDEVPEVPVEQPQELKEPEVIDVEDKGGEE